VSIAQLGTADPDPRRGTRTGVEQRWRVVAVLAPTPAVDGVLSEPNEQRNLARSARGLPAYLKQGVSFSARITIAIHPVIPAQVYEPGYDQLGQFKGQLSWRQK